MARFAHSAFAVALLSGAAAACSGQATDAGPSDAAAIDAGDAGDARQDLPDAGVAVEDGGVFLQGDAGTVLCHAATNGAPQCEGPTWAEGQNRAACRRGALYRCGAYYVIMEGGDEVGAEYIYSVATGECLADIILPPLRPPQCNAAEGTLVPVFDFQRCAPLDVTCDGGTN